MNSTRKQRRMFVLNAKKQYKLGKISKEDYLKLKNEIAQLGIHQHAQLRQSLLEQKGVKIMNSESVDVLDTELEDDFAPDDL